MPIKYFYEAAAKALPCIFEYMTRDGSLLLNLNSYELQGLHQLISYRKQFYPEENSASGFLLVKRRKQKTLEEIMNSFVNVFCQHNFANTDYSGLVELNKKHSSDKEVIENMSADTILKALTYIIWTDITNAGFFESMIKNYTLFYLLSRLELLMA